MLLSSVLNEDINKEVRVEDEKNRAAENDK